MAGLPLGRAAVIVFVVGAILFPLGMVGQEEGGLWENGPAWIGAVGWFGFLISLLLLMVIGLLALARSLTSRKPTAG